MVANTHRSPCSQSWLPCLGAGRSSVSRSAFTRTCSRNGRCLPVVHQSKGQSYHVEVEVNEDEDPEGVYKRFRNSCNLSGMVYEARRRQFFENTQDIKKRKQQEKGMRKMRDVRERFLQTYDDAHSDTPPFSELFAADEDIYDVLKDASYDEGLDSPTVPPRPQENRRQPDRGNGSRRPDNVVMRSVPSDGPKAAQQEAKAQSNGKPKGNVQTARTRRAARQQAGRKK